MTYRTQIAAALEEWDKGFLGVAGLFRNRSRESEDGAALLRGLMHVEPTYDDDLEKAVDWLLGRSGEEFRFAMLPDRRYTQLNHSSKLYQCLNTAVASAPPPNLRPAAPASSSSRSARHPPRSSSSSSHRAAPTPHARAVATTSSHATSSSSSSSRRTTTRSTTTTTPSRTVPERRPSSSSSSRVSLRSEAHQSLALMRWRSEWSGIEITDRPTGRFGEYEFTPNDLITTQQKGSAAAVVEVLRRKSGFSKATELPEYWIKLGHLVMGSKVGRCFSCAAGAVYSIVMTSECDDLVIVVSGAPKYDHHFVLLGTMEAINEKNEHAMYVVDLWDVQSGCGRSYVGPWSSYRYKSHGVEFFCFLLPEERASHFAYAKELGPPKKPRF